MIQWTPAAMSYCLFAVPAAPPDAWTWLCGYPTYQLQRYCTWGFRDTDSRAGGRVAFGHCGLHHQGCTLKMATVRNKDWTITRRDVTVDERKVLITSGVEKLTWRRMSWASNSGSWFRGISWPLKASLATWAALADSLSQLNYNYRRKIHGGIDMDSIIVITGVNKCSQPNNKSHSLCSKDYIYRLFSDLLLLHLQTFSSVQAMTHLCSIRYEILVHNQIVYRKFVHNTTQHNTTQHATSSANWRFRFS
jgi:hypothetical protein